MSADKLVRVAGLPTTYTVGGKDYGPSSGPLDVPHTLAAALGLSEVDEYGEVIPQEEEAEQDDTASAELWQERAAHADTRHALEQAQGVGQALDRQLTDQTAAWQTERESLTAERDAARKELADKTAEWEQQREALLIDTSAALDREKTAMQALADGKVIPADAHERLVAVKGIGDKLAQEVLDALTAAAPAQPEK